MPSFIQWKNHHIEDVEINLLLYALKERYGYDFTGYARASLKRRLLELSHYFDVVHLSDLIPLLLYDEIIAQTVINRITVPTSEFFRDPAVWHYLRYNIIPELASFPRINIWQAGCGHGQEAYSLAILLEETHLLKKVKIFSTDINPLFLAEAQKGCWSTRNLALWQSNYQQAGGGNNFCDFFQQTATELLIREELKHTIEFIPHNLVIDDVFKEMQLVVCRNVLLYFGSELQNRVVNLFTRSLERGGYLVLGRGESIIALHETHPELMEMDSVLQVYRKRIDDTYV
jgi:chemotaxis protein methyltransferase CheR